MASYPVIGPASDFGFLPQRKVRPDLYTPHHLQVPRGRFRLVIFQFQTVNARQTVEATETLDKDWVLWGLNGVYTNPNNDNAGFRVQIKHTIAATGKERLLFKNHSLNVNALGAAKSPFLLPETHLVQAGDTLYCELKNMSVDSTHQAWLEVQLAGVDVGQKSVLGGL